MTYLLWWVLGFLCMWLVRISLHKSTRLKHHPEGFPWRFLFLAWMLMFILAADTRGMTRENITLFTSIYTVSSIMPYFNTLVHSSALGKTFAWAVPIGVLPFILANLGAFYICITGRTGYKDPDKQYRIKFFAWGILAYHFEQIVPIEVLLPPQLNWVFVSNKFDMIYIIFSCILIAWAVDAIFKKEEV